MKEYKVEVVDSSKEAEFVMNKHAREGWEVKAVTERMRVTSEIVITFERERRI